MKGDIIFNDDKWIYDWLEWDATCPNDIKKAIENLQPGETLDVLVNSGGGYVTAGQEIYSLLVGRNDVDIKIQSMAGSAASVIAMANRSEISPVAMIMIHNVSGAAQGDYHDMQHQAEVLKQMNKALAQAYIKKTGKSEEEILKLMDKETYITANQALEMGFVDRITDSQQANYTNSVCGVRLTDEIRERVKAEKAAKDLEDKKKQEILNDLDLFGV